MIKTLIVDDNKDNRTAMKLLLDDFEDLLLVEAEDGKKAVEITKHVMPDIIFMDIMMPVMDGIEATKEIRTFDKKVLIIALSALSDDEHQSLMLKAGAEDYVSKPVNEELFSARMKNYLSIIEHRRVRDRMDGAVNLFSQSIYSKRVGFFVENEAGLIEFWEYAADRSESGDVSDAIRAIYNIGLTLLDTNKNFNIIVEEDDEKIYFTIVAVKIFTPQHIRDILAKEGPRVTLAIRNNEISVSSPKESARQAKEVDVEQNKIELDEGDAKILRMSHSEKTSAAEFAADLDPDVIDKLDKLEGNEETLDSLIYDFETKLEIETLPKIAIEITKFADELELLYEFHNIGYALKKLGAIINEISQEDIDGAKSKKLSMLLRNTFEDLVNWRKTIFVYKNTDDIHYLDSSLLNSCLQIELALKNAKIEEENCDDMELF